MSVFKLLRRLEALTAPAPSLAHDWDTVLADREAEEEVAEPRPAPRCAKCRIELGEAAAVSDIVAGMFCSDRCRKVAEIRSVFAARDSSPADPKPAATTPAADAEAVETSSPRRSPASALSFADYVVPAITDVLAEHQFHMVLDQCGCGEYMDDYDWREHVAEFLAERIETCLLSRFPEGK